MFRCGDYFGDLCETNIDFCSTSMFDVTIMDNVANMHELFTVSSHTQRKSISLAVCQPLVQCACSSTTFEPITS